MKLDFSRGGWATGDFVYAYSYRFPGAPEFIQQDDCVENRPDDTGAFGCDWNNISLLTKDAYSVGTRIETRCAFTGLGAPLIVIADRMYEDEGTRKYGDYIEIVLYKNGINIWRMHMDDAKNVTWNKELGVEFPVSEEEIHTLSAEISENGITAITDGKKIFWRCADLYRTFHLGIDACEGLNRFYDIEVTRV